jgi:hypothetical protein
MSGLAVVGATGPAAAPAWPAVARADPAWAPADPAWAPADPAWAPATGTVPVHPQRLASAQPATGAVPVMSVVDAVRRSARALHGACADLLPGYAEASREPWRQALLTAGCLDGRPRRAATRRAAPPMIVEDVVQPSDVLCALWLARRCGLFCPGSSVGDAIGLRSACEIVPAFADGTTPQRQAEVLAVLRANAAWRAHQMARAA